jgi:hypothetical protein
MWISREISQKALRLNRDTLKTDCASKTTVTPAATRTPSAGSGVTARFRPLAERIDFNWWLLLESQRQKGIGLSSPISFFIKGDFYGYRKASIC